MKKTLLNLAVLSFIASSSAYAMDHVDSEASLNAAVKKANMDSSITKIVFKQNVHISLNSPVVYTGKQALFLEGNGAVLNGEKSGESKEFYDKAEKVTTVQTKDGTLMFNTAADVSISDLSVIKSHTRGIVVTIPSDATGNDIHVTLNNVDVTGSALYGLHLDDNLSELDDGDLGSAVGINLTINNSNFINNGTGAIDFDGIRVDERAAGDIKAEITNTNIKGNGGDGIELDEAGTGDVNVAMSNVVIESNGAYNEKDLDDGFDIDEGDEGDLIVVLSNLQINHNRDEGLDFDEAGAGSVYATMSNISATYTDDEGIKLDEEDAGDIKASLSNIVVNNGGDDGIQFTELGQGQINAAFNNVDSSDNIKTGITVQQWLVEDEVKQAEIMGSVSLNNIKLSNNGKGNKMKTNGVDITN